MTRDGSPDRAERDERPSRRAFLKRGAATGALLGTASLGGCLGRYREIAGEVGEPADDRDAGDADEQGSSDDGEQRAYEWEDATLDSYWYSLYNMNTTIAVSGVGVLFPRSESQRQMFRSRLQAILANSAVDRPPIRNPNLNVAPFTEGDAHFTQEPVAPFSADVDRIHADTMAWDRSAMSGVVSPASVAWTHLKGVTWAKNFQNHFGLLPESMAARFRAQMLGTMAQLSIRTTLVDGGPEGTGALTAGDDTLALVSGFEPRTGEVVDATPRPRQHAAMVWFLSDMVSFAENGWYGYVNPEPLLPPERIQSLADGVAKATMDEFPPQRILEMGTARDLGVMLGAMGWYGTHAGSDQLRQRAAEYADSLADAVDGRVGGDGALGVDGVNQAAAQGAVGQGLLWASQIDGVSRRALSEPVLEYMTEELWDPDAGTFADGTGDGTYAITARDAGDITGGINAADAVFGWDAVQDQYATFYNQTFNRGRLQRAERPPSRVTDRLAEQTEEHRLPLPQNAGGEYGQAAVYNTEVTYDADADEWSVTDDRFTTAGALYLSNQDIWIARWGTQFYNGRGVPGETDEPEQRYPTETTTGTGTPTTESE